MVANTRKSSFNRLWGFQVQNPKPSVMIQFYQTLGQISLQPGYKDMEMNEYR
jgi:hypothetical protein